MPFSQLFLVPLSLFPKGRIGFGRTGILQVSCLSQLGSSDRDSIADGGWMREDAPSSLWVPARGRRVCWSNNMHHSLNVPRTCSFGVDMEVHVSRSVSAACRIEIGNVGVRVLSVPPRVLCLHMPGIASNTMRAAAQASPLKSFAATPRSSLESEREPVLAPWIVLLLDWG
ncbi:hypothetical protein BT67DRAFT_152411 [Trichocladium antarcticum]|uniref:Uncharacterized protein n=1 Tax=Trichocladium antarcticum TaxID=1450529 RepID=A0AAN6UH35_9PEZI|nr:hypothetical protein BT67DRAFT_152411 [Trichocladium antarcticum]